MQALKDMGYVYKRPSKTTPGHAPGKEEKQEILKRGTRNPKMKKMG